MRQLMSFKQFLDAGAPNIFFESFEEEVAEELSGSIKRTKLKKLEQLLKDWDYTYEYSSDMRDIRKGVAQEKEIINLQKEIGYEGLKMYRKFLKDKGLKEEDLTTPRLSAWEKLLHRKLKAWGMQTLDDLDSLEAEPRKRFKDELDKEWASSRENKNDVVVHESLKKPNPPRNLSDAVRQVTERSGFPDMDVSTKNIQLGYGEDRPVGGQSKHGFCDAGNLYENTPTWQAPSPQRKRGFQDK